MGLWRPWSMMLRLVLLLAPALVLGGCGGKRFADDGGGSFDGGDDAATVPDGGSDRDGAPLDAPIADAAFDAGPDGDAAVPDAGGADTGSADASTLDAGGTDGGSPDAGARDAGSDAGSPDAGSPDAGSPDAGTRDAGPPAGGCVSGATGTHVVRFRWRGTTSGSTAWVDYEANTLPDRSRWRVTANSRSIGYTPVFRDPFLGEGGLDLSGTVFIDVEISTAGLRPVRNATLAIYGRSFSTTASGSFSWMSFSGSGATPSGFVSNVAPYRWYGADATSALPAGDARTLLRIEAGPPSGALIVSRGEICFNAP